MTKYEGKYQKSVYICCLKIFEMIHIAVGESNFETVIRNNIFYQDRTPYIQTLEDFKTKYLMYLRPRRFGKSLWLSTLRHYYGSQYKNDFERLFGQTFIGKNVTENAHNYLILNFDFSGINTDTPDKVHEGFLAKVFTGFYAFFHDYGNYFTPQQKKDVFKENAPNLAIAALFNTWVEQGVDKKIYVLIDEYDHFANEIIAFDFHNFKHIVSENGFVRKFYEIIKSATTQGIVERILITGVSPITLDGMTSGFNIATNITTTSIFHGMMGFEQAEVKGILEQLEIPAADLPSVLEDVKDWYDGYLFSTDRPNLQRVYNSTMVLSFAKQYQTNNAYPDNLLDPNIATDYAKVRRIFSIGDREFANKEALSQLLHQGEVSATLVKQYNFERGFSSDDFLSLLFYMGFLTIKSKALDACIFTFPNYVITKLYADYFITLTRETHQLPIDNDGVNAALRSLATQGDPNPLFDEMTLILKTLSPRDAKDFNEMTLKAIVVSLLHQQSFYYVHSEYASKQFYMDVFLEAIGGYKPNYEVAFEFKYLKKGEAKALNTKLSEAVTQLEAYLQTPLFDGKTTVKAWAVVVAQNKIHSKMVR
jgi:Predicted AAA-ATPase/PD-(D/E)XK nuclease superfamily